MTDLLDAVLHEVRVVGEAIAGRSTVPLAREALKPGMLAYDVPLAWNSALPASVEFSVDALGFDLLLRDAFCTPLLAWRFLAIPLDVFRQHLEQERGEPES